MKNITHVLFFPLCNMVVYKGYYIYVEFKKNVIMLRKKAMGGV